MRALGTIHAFATRARDAAMEEYLFVERCVSMSSELWKHDVAATGFAAGALYVGGLYAFYTIVRSHDEPYAGHGSLFNGFGGALAGTGGLALFGILAGAVLLIAVGGLVAATNEAAGAVRALFLRAKPQDFGLIGGRELWLEYLDSNPIAYTVHGLVMNGALFNSLAYALASCLVMVVLAIQKDTSVADDDDGDWWQGSSETTRALLSVYFACLYDVKRIN